MVRKGDTRVGPGQQLLVALWRHADGSWVVGRLGDGRVAVPAETRARATVESWPLVSRGTLRPRPDICDSAVEVV